jgi:hypothetical protein
MSRRRKTNFEELIGLGAWCLAGSAFRAACAGLIIMVVFCGLMPILLIPEAPTLLADLFKAAARGCFIGGASLSSFLFLAAAWKLWRWEG